MNLSQLADDKVLQEEPLGENRAVEIIMFPYPSRPTNKRSRSNKLSSGHSDGSISLRSTQKAIEPEQR
jgi:hypothetical protein